MPFLTEPEPEPGASVELLPGISRIVADNPGPMTYFGTNTYLIDTPQGLAVLDPGPADHPAHLEAILRHTEAKIAFIMVSHTHHDHVGAVAALQAATGAPTVGFRDSAVPAFQADIKLDHRAEFAGMQALHTPGHASDHLCFAFPAANGERVLFSADHVMSWSTSIVSPPGGDMADYIASLNLLLARKDDIYLPAHGPPLREPRDLVRGMLAHRMMREQAIVKVLLAEPSSIDGITDALYAQLNPRLRQAAERSVLAHLLKLQREGMAVCDGDLWRALPAAF